MNKRKIFLPIILILVLIISLSTVSAATSDEEWESIYQANFEKNKKYVDWIDQAYEVDGAYFHPDVKNNGTWFYVVSKDNKLGEIASIIAYNGEETNVVIPEKIDGYPVVRIEMDVSGSTGICYVNGSGYFPILKNNIESITIPKTIEEIVGVDIDNTISYLSKPDKKIDSYMYLCFKYYMNNLKEIIVDEDNKYFSSIDGVLYSKDKTVLISYPNNKQDKEYTVPETVTRIYRNAFGGISKYNGDDNAYVCNLKKLTITKNVELLEELSGYEDYLLYIDTVVLDNVKLNKTDLKNNLTGRNEIIVYEDSPAHKYYKSYIDKKDPENRPKLTVLDNPYIEKEEEKTESEKEESKIETSSKKETSSKTESVVSEPAKTESKKETVSDKTETSIQQEASKTESVASEEQEEASIEIVSESDEVVESKPVPKENDKIIIVILAVAFVIVIGLGCYVLIKRKNRIR